MFMKSIIAATTLAALTATTALAGAGSDQLAAQVGVAPGVYSDAQLIQLQDAQRENDQSSIAYILSQANDTTSRADLSGVHSTSEGATQMAAALGLAPGAYSLNEMTRLSDAIRENDAQAVAFILNGSKGGNANDDRGSVSPGKAQLAATLGLDPAAYTTSELAAKYLASIS